MKHVMFDIDGTLVQSYDFDDLYYRMAVEEVTGLSIESNWTTYPHVTDLGILKTFIKRQAPQLDIQTLEPQVKSIFIELVREHITRSSIREIKGAKRFLRRLQLDKKIVVSIGTGGWRETALLKLQAAGFDTNQLVLTTSNEHYSRTEIMKISASKVSSNKKLNFTYFGDAEWDMRACKDLKVNFVMIGEKPIWPQNLINYEDQERALEYIMKPDIHF